jgi:hypothetical protein
VNAVLAGDLDDALHVPTTGLLELRNLSNPVDLGCERPFDVAVSLDGEQPVTEMRIYREKESGGTYVAPLALRVKSVFTPVGGGAADRRVISRLVELGPGNHSYWTTTDRVGTVDEEPVLVDTDGDGVPESAMPGPSNFVAGLRPTGSCPTQQSTPTCPPGLCPYQSCHCDPCSEDPYDPDQDCEHLHCIWVCVEPPPGVMCMSAGV